MNIFNLNHFTKLRPYRVILCLIGQYGASVRGIPYAGKESPYATNRNCPAYMVDFSFRY